MKRSLEEISKEIYENRIKKMKEKNQEDMKRLRGYVFTVLKDHDERLKKLEKNLEGKNDQKK